ncbi:MAG: sensor histidine kinase [Chitinophagaceae bacterium]
MKKENCIPSILVFLLAFCISGHVLAQGFPDSSYTEYTDISRISLVKNIGKNVSTVYIGGNEEPGTIPGAAFKPGILHKGTVPNSFVTKKILLRFNLNNSADSTISVYFFPGFYYDDIRLFRVKGEAVERLPSILPPITDSVGYRQINLPPGDSAIIIAELHFVKTYNNAVRPRLVNSEYLESYISNLFSIHNRNNMITYIFCGLLLMMILFSIASFLQGANPEFLYYSGYAIFLGGMLFAQARHSFHATRTSFFVEGYLDFILQGLGIMFYMVFMQRFLNTREKHPFLYKLYNAGIALLTIAILSYTWFHYFSNNYNAENLVENSTKISLLLMIIIFLVYSLRQWKDKLLRYLFWGNLCLFIFALLSQMAVLFGTFFKNLPGVFSSSVVYYEIGLLLELVFFLAGLNHKNRRQLISQTKERETLKAQNLLKEYEKEIAVYKAQQEERDRISADMHDELGAGMTAIRLMSEIARNKMKENTPVEIEKISQSANDVLNKMNAIIWSMNSGNDTLDNLISYIRAYAQEYFDNTPVQCKVHTPDTIPGMELTGDKRRNIFLSIKETLNNVLKHSAASNVVIDIEYNHQLRIRIADDGKGIDLENIRQFGNGLKNIKRRMESIGGSFTIENKNGTLTTLALPL